MPAEAAVPGGSLPGDLSWVRRAGQSLWLDNLDHAMLSTGALRRWASELGVSGLTCNPSILARSLTLESGHDASLRLLLERGVTDPLDLVYAITFEDLIPAAGIFHPTFERSRGQDGFVSLEVPPDLAHRFEETVAWGKQLWERAHLPNLLIKVPGTAAGLAAGEELIAVGVGVNFTLLFSEAHYLAAADSYLRALGRRQVNHEPLAVPSVASVFVSRWDAAADPQVPPALHHRLGLAMARRIYAAYRKILAGERWVELANAGAHPQRLLWASTSTKDPELPPTFYARALVLAGTIDTLPEATLGALASGPPRRMGTPALAEAEKTLGRARAAGLDVEALGQSLQAQGAERFAGDWAQLVTAVGEKARRLVPGAVG